MERCENCGSVLDRADRFCKNCGLAIATMPLPVPPGVSSGQHVPMMPGSPLLFNVTTVQGRSGFNGALSRGGVSPQTPVPPGINGGVLAPTIAGQFFAPMPPSPPRTNNHGPSGPLAQERFSGSGSQPPSDDTAATTPVEVDKLYEQMSNLAELFLKLFNAIPPAGRERELSGTPLRGKAFKGLVMSATNVYLSPSTQEAIDHIAPPGTPVRVFAQVAGQGEMPGHVWYRISKPSEPPRYIYAWPVINLYQMLQRYFQLATQLWEAVAANHFEEVINPKATFQDDVKKLEEQLNWLLERCSNAKQNSQAKGSLRWRRRIRLYRRALEAWRHCLDEKPSTVLSDPTECGRILYRAWGYLGLGSCNWYEYILIKSLQWLNVLCSVCSLVLLLAILINFSTNELPFPWYIVFFLASLGTSVYLLWFSASKTSLSVMMGYVLRRQQALDAAQSEPVNEASFQSSSPFQPFFRSSKRILRKLPSILLRLWLWVVGLSLEVYLLAVLCEIILLFFLPGVLGLNEGSGQIIVGVLPLVGIAITFVIAFPFTLKMQVQMRRELRDHPHRPPEARRSSVRLAMKLLPCNTTCLLILAIVVLNTVPAFKFPWANIPSGSLKVNLVHQVTYLLVVVWPYWQCLGRPYRRGLRHWKTWRFGVLATHRTRLDRRLRQVPSSSPLEKEPSFVQDHYTLWQYYRAQEEDVKRTSSKPFTLVQQGGGLLITLVSAVLSGVITNPTIIGQIWQGLSSILKSLGL